MHLIFHHIGYYFGRTLYNLNRFIRTTQSVFLIQKRKYWEPLNKLSLWICSMLLEHSSQLIRTFPKCSKRVRAIHLGDYSNCTSLNLRFTPPLCRTEFKWKLRDFFRQTNVMCWNPGPISPLLLVVSFALGPQIHTQTANTKTQNNKARFISS